MTKGRSQISVRGRQTQVPSIMLDDIELVTTGSWLRIAGVRDEHYCENDPVRDPEKLIQQFRDAGGKADMFSFSQRVPDVSPKYDYPLHWDNAAVLPVRSYSDWWENLSQETRRNVRLASKRGVVVRKVPFNENLVQGITGIYNETPFRQGRRFWHYGKSFETVKHDNGTFLARSCFIGAYLGDELIGFIKMVYVNRLASIMQILSKIGHQDKRPANAMIAKAVEICAEKDVSHLLYCKYVYHKNRHDALTEFKRRNGFTRMNYPRYFVPLTLKGRLAIPLKLQLGLVEVLPRGTVVALLKARAGYHRMLQRSSIVLRV